MRRLLVVICDRMKALTDRYWFRTRVDDSFVRYILLHDPHEEKIDRVNDFSLSPNKRERSYLRSHAIESKENKTIGDIMIVVPVKKIPKSSRSPNNLQERAPSPAAPAEKLHIHQYRQGKVDDIQVASSARSSDCTGCICLLPAHPGRYLPEWSRNNQRSSS